MGRDIIASRSMITVPRCVFPKDAEVLEFLANEMVDFNPYREPLTAGDLFAAARKRFGDYRLIGLILYLH
jgi:hypothetical protein